MYETTTWFQTASAFTRQNEFSNRNVMLRLVLQIKCFSAGCELWLCILTAAVFICVYCYSWSASFIYSKDLEKDAVRRETCWLVLYVWLFCVCVCDRYGCFISTKIAYGWYFIQHILEWKKNIHTDSVLCVQITYRTYRTIACDHLLSIYQRNQQQQKYQKHMDWSSLANSNTLLLLYYGAPHTIRYCVRWQPSQKQIETEVRLTFLLTHFVVVWWLTETRYDDDRLRMDIYSSALNLPHSY